MKTKILSILALLLTVTQGAWAQTKTYTSYTVTGGSVSYWSSCEHDKLLDNNTGTKWCTVFGDGSTATATCGEWVEFNTPHAIIPTGYILTTCEDTNTHYGRNPKNWTLKGKLNAGDAWTVLTDVTNASMPKTNHTDKSFDISNTDRAYKYFRFEVNAIDGSTYNIEANPQKYKFQLSRLLLKGTDAMFDASFATGSGGTGWSISPTSATDGTTVSVSYSGDHKVKSVKYNSTEASGSGDTRTFSMPTSNVEVTTELWYKLAATETLDNNKTNYGSKSDFFLDRTLTANVWNTFASPFAIAAGDMEKYFGAGAKVRQLESTEVAGTVLTLNFEDATSIVAGKPYLVKPAVNVDFSADGKEFAGVDLTAASATPTPTTYVDFVPTLGKTEVTGDVKDILILNTSGTLVHPTAAGNMKGFRGYFKMHDASANAKAFVMNFSDDTVTGIINIAPATPEKEDNNIYTIDGRRIEGQPTQKGIYIQNGKKVIK